jgi:cysteinyl-tRNA synthetase
MGSDTPRKVITKEEVGILLLALILHDTLSASKKKFEPIKQGEVRMFVCGPTVYDSTHLGHARTFIVYDVLARYLSNKGFKVFFIMNLTDIEDKIFEKAKREKTSYQEISQKYSEEFKEVLRELNIGTVSLLARASDYLDRAVSQISKMLSDGSAYVVEGNVYFDTSTFPEYGKLSHQSPLEIRFRRIEPSPEKKNQADFLLWRRVDEYPSWDSPFGKGRPGWHIEDTAISISNLGQRYDIHGGGLELIFPHHEAEIAQAEVLTGTKPFVNYWVHTGLLKVKGRKMSKSLGNYILVRDLLKKYDANSIRMLCLSTHYSKDINFNERALTKADNQASKIVKASIVLQKQARGTKSYLKRVLDIQKQFYRVMDNDLNTPKAMASLLALVRLVDARSENFDSESWENAKGALGAMCKILGISV